MTASAPLTRAQKGWITRRWQEIDGVLGLCDHHPGALGTLDARSQDAYYDPIDDALRAAVIRQWDALGADAQMRLREEAERNLAAARERDAQRLWAVTALEMHLPDFRFMRLPPIHELGPTVGPDWQKVTKESLPCGPLLASPFPQVLPCSSPSSR